MYMKLNPYLCLLFFEFLIFDSAWSIPLPWPLHQIFGKKENKMTTPNPSTPDWNTLPVPKQDGAASHLEGMQMPALYLDAVDGTDQDLQLDMSSFRGTTVIFAFPKTGQPGVEVPKDWDMIPGARGCTPHTCAFRDLSEEFKKIGVDRVFGLSTQGPSYQRELAKRLHLPFPLLCDNDLQLTKALNLPTFTYNGETLLKRFALVLYDGLIAKVFYPVFPPDRNAQEVLDWLRQNKNF